MGTVLHRKLVVVGDGACGKTTLLIRFHRGYFDDFMIPTVFENYASDVKVGNYQIKLALWDTAGQEDYDRLRPLSYPNSHIILLCFSIGMPDSLENIEEKWVPEVLHFCHGVPYLLIGCKKDLCLDPRTLEWLNRTGEHPVSFEEGERVAKKIGAGMYLECSALTGEGVMKVFEEAAAVSIHTSDRCTKARKCVIV